MRTLLALVLAVLLLAPGASAKQPNNKPELKLTASIDTAAPERQPVLVVEIFNQSGHTLRIPEPPLLCKAAPGALSLQVKFTPENASQPEAQPECDLEVDGSGLADIRERAKNWVVIKAGQNYEARRPLAMGVDTNAHGTYELWVHYDGPSANEEDAQKLKDAGIAAPSGTFQSGELTYKINAPKQ
jgi:hypothetical protein